MDAVRRRKAEYATYLGQTDYDKQRQESQEMAKLQFGLALASRGFGAMGAQPRPGEMAISTLGREMLAPLGADAMAVAQQLYQQKQQRQQEKRQEERKLKLAALEAVSGEEAAHRALALELMPDPRTTKLFADPYVVVNRGDDGELSLVKEADGNAAIQVRQSSDSPAVIDIKTQLPHILLTNQEIMKLSDFTAASKVGGKAANVGYMQNINSKKYVHVARQGPGQPAYNTLTGVLITDPDKWIWVGSSIPGSGTSATELNQADRLAAVRSEMSRLQAQQQGEGQVYSPRSALFWDQALHLAGKFPYKFVVDPNDRSKDRFITDASVQGIIRAKEDSMAQTLLKSNFGEQTAEVKSQRIAQAVQRILAPSAYVWFGDKAIPEFGYVPSEIEQAGAAKGENAKEAMAIMREDPNAVAADIFSVLPYAPSSKDLNSNPFRIRVATEHFPDAFGFTGEAGTDSYVPELITQRADIEAGLRNARILPDANRADHRASIQSSAENIREARETVQNKDAAADAQEEVNLRLEFRRALLAFRNAAAETNVEGFWTGTLAAGLARVGLGDFISKEGAEHWERLTVASDRLSEGLSRRVGKEFGDVRISNYDAKAYQKLLANIKRGGDYNQFLIDDGLALLNRELDRFMQLGGKVAYSEKLLQQVAEAGVDFSQLKTQMNWHGHGYYGKNRYAASLQKMPSLSTDQRNTLVTSGKLQDTMYSGFYSVPMTNDGYILDTPFAWSEATSISRKGPIEFEDYVQKRANVAEISVDAMRERIVGGILSHNVWRDTQSRVR